jgi:hypothetical protein
MERSTGKTMDAYVEIKSVELAEEEWYHAFGTRNGLLKIGQRVVDVVSSCQAELMRELFPRAKCCYFDADICGTPRIVPNRDIFSTGYKGIMTDEEVSCMQRHAENPARVSLPLAHIFAQHQQPNSLNSLLEARTAPTNA